MVGLAGLLVLDDGLLNKIRMTRAVGLSGNQFPDRIVDLGFDHLLEEFASNDMEQLTQKIETLEAIIEQMGQPT